MPHCTKCGVVVAENSSFCPSCGAAQSAPGTPALAAGDTAQIDLSENVAALLCYLFWWITGIIFFLNDKRPYVRYHAAQSIVVFGGINILLYILGSIFGIGFLFAGWGGFTFGFLIYQIIHIASIVLWIVCMVKAYQGERFRVPYAADLAESLAVK